MSKMTEVQQRPEESPIEFYERLCEALRVYIALLTPEHERTSA